MEDLNLAILPSCLDCYLFGKITEEIWFVIKHWNILLNSGIQESYTLNLKCSFCTCADRVFFFHSKLLRTSNAFCLSSSDLKQTYIHGEPMFRLLFFGGLSLLGFNFSLCDISFLNSWKEKGSYKCNKGRYVIIWDLCFFITFFTHPLLPSTFSF